MSNLATNPKVSTSGGKKKVGESVSGCRATISSNQLLISSGIPNLDDLLNVSSGIPLGTCIIITENLKSGQDKSYGQIMAKYFLSQGLADNHSIFVASPSNVLNDKIINNLPSFSSDGDEKNKEGNKKEETLKIAWRYKNSFTDVTKTSLNHAKNFNLQKTLTRDYLNTVEIGTFHPESTSDFSTPIDHYPKLLKSIVNYLNASKCKKYSLSDRENPLPASVLRIVIFDLGNPIYGTSDLSRFLISLKAVLRNYLATALLLTQSNELNIGKFGDFVADISPFHSEEMKQTFKEYHGVVTFPRMANINCLAQHPTQTAKKGSTYLFKSYRTKFTIEKMTLPPSLDFGGSLASSDKKDDKASRKISNHNIDF